MLPAVQSAKNSLLSNAETSVNYTNSNDSSEMIDENVNNDIDNITTANALHRPNSLPVPSCPPDKIDTESNNYRNRGNTKVKLLVRSHAMRESTSPPREPHNNNGPMSPRSPQLSDSGDNNKNDSNKFGNGTPSTNNSSSKLNNNESIHNSNLSTAQSPKKTRNIATSPTCRAPSRNGQSSPLQMPKSTSTSPTNIRDKNDCQRSKATSPLNPTITTTNKCNNCVKNNHNDKPGLLQTPQSPSKSLTTHYSTKNINLTGQNGYHHRTSDNNRRVCNNQCSNQCSSNTLSVGNRTRHKLRHQNSSQGSGSLDSVSPCLSRDSSTELYTDSTGIDLEQFIAVTINRNQKDRSVLLKIERELIEFAKDRQKSCHKFPNMSSYNRMLVHRVAAYFGMEHNVDQSGLSVIVTRTKNMRIPDTRFKQHIRDDLLLSEEPRRSILKRDSNSFEDGFNFKSPDRMSGDYCRRSKSFEEREVEYEKVRRRIFKDSSGESSELASWPYWSSSESSESTRYRLLHPSDHPTMRQTRLSKGESCDGRESFRGVLRPSVSKSFSFGGYTRGMLSRGDSVTSTRSASARLTKQDSGASVCSRLSPSSSGYKSQSQRSDATISPSPSPSPVPQIPCNHIQLSSQSSTSLDVSQENETVMWAVSSISSVPPGSIIMNPRTNQPYTNIDGSIYRFDPDNPPKIFNDIAEISETPSETPVEKYTEMQGSPRHTAPIKNYSKKQKNQNKSSNNNSNINHHNRITNTATSPTLPFPVNPPSPPPVHECNQSTVKSTVKDSQPCVHTSINQPYTNYSQANTTDMTYGPPPPSIPPPPLPTPSQSYQTYQSQNMIVQRHSEIPSAATQQQQQQQQQQQPPVAPTTDMVFNQNNLYTNYSMMTMQPGAPQPQTNDVAELSGYFMGMNVYEQSRINSDTAPATPQYSVPPPLPPASVPNGHHQHQQSQQIQTGFWQPPPPPLPQSQTMTHSHPPNPPTQQPMYFVPPAATAMTVGQSSNDRSSMNHQRFTSNYAYNPQSMTPPNQATPNYVNGYPISYNSMPTVTPTPAEFTYQSPLPVIPTYYPAGQSGMQPPVMWRVPTPPHTPTSNQMPGIPVMYVNSGTYPPPTMVAAGSFGHQLSNTNASPSPGATAYMTPSILPNLVFRQNVPIVGGGIRASTPSSSQRTSRSPTPAHEFFNNGANGGGNSGVGVGDNRNAQAQSRYPLPMYQGLHIVQGDIRLMHPGVANNSRIQYTPVPSSPVVQGCPRPFRPPSYSSNTSGCPTPNSFDGRNQKIRKQRSKVTTLPPTGARSNVYQVSSMPPVSSNSPKDMREGIVKVTINRQNQLVQY